MVSINHDIGAGNTIVVSRGANGTTATSHSLNVFNPPKIYGDNRLNHKMTIFYNETCEFYLKNMTRTNMNQPAEYKLGCVMKGKDSDGNIRTVTVESISPVITADEEYYGKTVEQSVGANRTFGKPVYLETEDRVRYHKKIDTNDNQIYIERYYEAPTAVSATKMIFGNQAADTSQDGSFMNLQSGTFPSTLSEGYIKIIGTDNNDGYYEIVTKHSSTQIEVRPFGTNTNAFAFESVTISSNPVYIYHNKINHHRLTFSNGASSFYQRESVSPETSGLYDMSPHIWMGKNVYAQSSSTGYFSTSLEHGKLPTYLGWISDINVTSGNKSDIISVSKCKLVKPIRTTTETTVYVDDARNLKINDIISNGSEQMTITAIKGNTLTVTRGSSPQTTVLDSYSLTGATNGNYLIHPTEEYDFSRTLYADIPELYEGIRVVDGSGNSLSDSDEYGAHFLTDTWKEISYVLRPFHLAMSYDATANRVSLFLDGKEVETQVFSEGNLRINSITHDGSPNVTIDTIDPHGLSTGDWIKLEGTGVTNLNGIWQVAGPTANSFTINCVNNVSSSTTNGTLTDVTIRTNLNFREFEFDASDCYLGSNGNDELQTRRASQFMGELHEFAITKEFKDNFNTLDTLVPNFRNTLVYFRFEGDNS